jgi:photosystem II stability/assembly factor-like uncharacterized protein
MKRIVISAFGFLIVTGIVLTIHHIHAKRSIHTAFLTGLVTEMKPDGYAEYYRDITVPFGQSESGYVPGYRIRELNKAMSVKKGLTSSFSDTLIWIERGPVNVGGRTRTVLVDPDDPTGNTWYAGTASGGIWKTDDAGKSWTDLTPDLPNLSTVSLAMAPSNHDVIYAGTGEGFGNVGGVTGDGIFLTTDRGETWNQIESTRGNRNFSYINKLWVDPVNHQVVIAATNTGIFKTLDAGASWNMVYDANGRVQDLRQNPGNPSTLFASVNSVGVIKSYDKGETWIPTGSQIVRANRISVDVSPVDTAIVFASAENTLSEMDVYISDDAGETWVRHSPDTDFFNFHRAQGWYNNAIKAHPLESRKVFVGGVYVGLLSFGTETIQSEPEVLSVDTVGTTSFLDFINFGGEFLGGGMTTGISEEANVTIDDFVGVELRFGPGITQKAHRFLVPDGEGPGVPYSDYEYQDYVEVPFQVWDITNNRQLMVSFRDQEREGTFNLIERDPNNVTPGREYIFVSGFPYDPDGPHPSIVNENENYKGGHFEKMLYFFWPTLAAEGTWDPVNIPASALRIEFGSLPAKQIETTVISSGSRNTNLHVDHHDLVIIPPVDLESNMRLLSGNDGGIGYSQNGGATWEQMSNGFVTTQFYGVAKKSGADEFIGGLQDNGTYQSSPGEVASLKHDYQRRIGGDGFQTLWHPNGTAVLATVYNNQIYRSDNGGSSWSVSASGLGDDGPFITKLSFHPKAPNVVFTIGAEGVYRHTNFGNPSQDWRLTAIPEGLTISGVASSALNVKVSRADPTIVWAGSGMFTDPLLNIFVSSDRGVTFNPVTSIDDNSLGYISGMATHPVDPNTAYVLFSYFQTPKIFRTTDRGETWEDISGFGKDTVSSTGFPDVSVHDLLVMPHDPNVIWAATEIGIVESLDNGGTWNLLESDFPSVSVYQLDYQDNQVILATHGRGIWTAGNFELPDDEETSVVQAPAPASFSLYPNPAGDVVSLRLSQAIQGTLSVNVYTLSGQRIKSDIWPVNATGTIHTMNVADMLPGTYIVEINGESFAATKQLVVF